MGLVFFWFTYVEPSRNARVGVGMFLMAIWSLRLCLALLTRRPLPLEPFRGELEYRCRDGSTLWGEVMVYPQQDADGIFRQLLGVSRNICERKRHELELRQAQDLREQANRALQAANVELQRLATTDGLTGVWNRRHFEQVMAAEIQRAGRYGEPLSL